MVYEKKVNGTPFRISSIAIIDSMGGFGMNAYTFELAEGPVSQRVLVDVYNTVASSLEELPVVRNHRCFPVLGSALFKQQLKAWRLSCSVLPDIRRQNSCKRAEPHVLRNTKLWVATLRIICSLTERIHRLSPEGLRQASWTIAFDSDNTCPKTPELQWPAIARNVLTMIESQH